jgi:hypothetical protein
MTAGHLNNFVREKKKKKGTEISPEFFVAELVTHTM